MKLGFRLGSHTPAMAATFVKDQVGFAGVSIRTSFAPGFSLGFRLGSHTPATAAMFVIAHVGFAGVSIQTSFVPGLANAASKDSARVWCERCGCGCTYVSYVCVYVSVCVCVCCPREVCVCVCVCVCGCVCVCVCLCVWSPLNFDRASELCFRDTKTTTKQRHMCPYSKPRTKHQRVLFVIMLYMSLLSCGGALKEQQHTGICAPTASPAQNTNRCIFFQSISGAGCGRLLQVVNSRKTALQACSTQ